jgi:hypothetical protein
MVVRCTGAYLGLARSQQSRLVLAPEVPRVMNINAMHGVQRVVTCILEHNLPILTSFSHLLLYP